MKLLRRIPKEELIADIIFFIIPAVISLLVVILFDMHWSFYPGREIQFIFTNKLPYLIAFFAGGTAGFFLIKLLMFGFIEEEKAIKKRK
ncbi:MAG: hypothetical protein PHC66_01130 [Candidatus Nanoarchaeia archaeon]|nr:hypothetical protein [Candidatus Nanoarchaeia archaeon]MDD5239097.1 hypothetical protein [Candidatus Nanoarchaeia archaeon]